MSRYLCIALLGTAALGACVPMSREGMRERRPTLETNTSLSVAQIAGCIGDSWQKLDGTTISTPRSDGMSIAWGDPPAALIDVRDLGATRQVTMFGPYTVRKGMNRRRVAEVRACL